MKVQIIGVEKQTGVSKRGQGDPYTIYTIAYMRPVIGLTKTEFWSRTRIGSTAVKDSVQEQLGDVLWAAMEKGKGAPLQAELVYEEGEDRQGNRVSNLIDVKLVNSQSKVAVV